MKILVLHHVEEMWEGSFNKYKLIPKIIEHVNRAKYDKVILTCFEYSYNYNTYEELAHLVDRVEEWCYGYGYGNEESAKEVEEYYGFDAGSIVEVSSHHKWGFVYDWMKELQGHKVSLAGGHREECLLTLSDTLDSMGIKYRKIEHCIYG